MTSCDAVPWTMDTDSDLGDYDDEYDYATNEDDLTSDLEDGDALIDPTDATVETDTISGCIQGIETGILIGTDGGVKKRRKIRLRHLPPITKRIHKKPKAPVLPGA